MSGRKSGQIAIQGTKILELIMDKTMKNLKVQTLSVGLLVLLNINSAKSEIALGEAWKSDNVTGYAGKNIVRLNFGEATRTIVRQKRSENEDFGSTTTSEDYGPFITEEVTYAGVRKLSWFEDKNRPCTMVAKPKLLNYFSVQSSYEKQITVTIRTAEKNFCKGKPGNEKEVRLPKGYFARGVSVCTTDKKNTKDNRLKGIKLYGAKIDSNANVIKTNVEEANKHTNCKDNWHKPIFCQAGKIITGFEIHKKGKAGKMYMTGLGIKCREVKYSDSAIIY